LKGRTNVKRSDIYNLIRSGDYQDAAFMLLEQTSPQYGTRISSPGDSFSILRKYGAKRKEYFVALLLNGAHEVIKEEVISIGTVNKTVVHPREVFYPAIFHNAVAIIVCHNHPSGRVDPSSEDREITIKLKNASDILGIALLDHIIVG
jgi:DNA repair protein RadC